MKLFIKNIAAYPALTEVRSILENLGLHFMTGADGEIEINESFSAETYGFIKEKLQNNGVELLADRESILTEKIKNIIIEMIHFSEELPVTKYSNYISAKLKTNYTYLSKIFSRVKNITIEHFIILQKIEKVKQLLLMDDLTLSQIALKLNYSSTAHLSAQFKKTVGVTPSLFKKVHSREFSFQS